MLTKDMVKSSMEAKWRMNQLKMYIAIPGIFLLFIAFVGVISGLQHGDFALSFEVTGIVMLVFALMFLPFVLFTLYKYRALFQNLNDYEIYEVRLDHPGTSYWYRGAIYYTVTIETKAGYKVSADTKPLWSGGAFASFRLDEYNNKKIRIAYNEQTDEMMVLGDKL